MLLERHMLQQTRYCELSLQNNEETEQLYPASQQMRKVKINDVDILKGGHTMREALRTFLSNYTFKYSSSLIALSTV